MLLKIAVTYADGLIFQHFGHTPAFKIYEIADSTVIAARVVETAGSDHGALAGFLQAQDVAALMREAGFRGVDTAYDTCGIERVVCGHI